MMISSGMAEGTIEYKKEFSKYDSVVITPEECAYSRDKSLIESIIPSKDMRAYHEKIGYTYDDFTIAAMISWSTMPYFRKMDELTKIMNETKDETLKEQLEYYIDYMEYSFKAVKYNQDKEFVYVLNIQWDEKGEFEENGYFINFDDALDFSKRAGKVAKSIDKFRIVVDKSEYADLDDEFISCYEGDVLFDKDGNITRCYADDVLEPDFGDKGFNTAYIHIPYPFRHGDVIQIVTQNNSLGIVCGYKTEEEINEFYEKHKDSMDYSDYQVVIEDGWYDKESRKYLWGHQHIKPLNLEYVDLENVEQKIGTELELIEMASLVMKGQAGVGALQYYTSMYEEKCRENNS